MAPKNNVKGGKGKGKDASDAGGKDAKGGKGLKPATSINVRHILVCGIPFLSFFFLSFLLYVLLYDLLFVFFLFFSHPMIAINPILTIHPTVREALQERRSSRETP